MKPENTVKYCNAVCQVWLFIYRRAVDFRQFTCISHNPDLSKETIILMFCFCCAAPICFKCKQTQSFREGKSASIIFMFSIIMFYYSSVITVVITCVICNKTRRKKPKLVSLIWFFEFLSTPWGHRWGYECRLTGLLHHNRLVHSISVQQLHRSPPLLPFLKHDEILRYLNSTSNSLPTWSGLCNVQHVATSSQKEKKKNSPENTKLYTLHLSILQLCYKITNRISDKG